MKAIVFFIVTCLIGALYAEKRVEYRARKAFEAELESGDIQTNAIRECAVSRIDACVHPLLLQLKKEGKENAQLRREAANAIGHLKAAEARDTLLAMISKETDIQTKGAAIRALGRIGNKADIKFIAGFLGDAEPVMRRRAARALFYMDDNDASAEVAGKIAGEKDDYTRVEMLNTALKIQGGQSSYATALITMLSSNDRMARLRAAEVFAAYHNIATIGELERAYAIEHDEAVRAALHHAILVTNFAQ